MPDMIPLASCTGAQISMPCSVPRQQANLSISAPFASGYRGTAFLKERINLKALKLLENFSRLHAAVMR